jgi:hypothetical protein
VCAGGAQPQRSTGLVQGCFCSYSGMLGRFVAGEGLRATEVHLYQAPALGSGGKKVL